MLRTVHSGVQLDPVEFLGFDDISAILVWCQRVWFAILVVAFAQFHACHGFTRASSVRRCRRCIELAEKIKKGQFKTGKLGGLQSDDDGTVERGSHGLSNQIRNHKHGGI